MNQDIIALAITVVTLILFSIQLFPIAVTALLAALAMIAFHIIDFSDYMAQFGNANMFSIICFMIIGGTLYETGIAPKLGAMILGKWKNNKRLFLAVLIVVVAVFTSFLSMVTVTAMFLPIVAGFEKESRGLITKKDTFMAVGFAATAGGCGTLIAFPSQHNLINNLLIENGCTPMSFFYGTPAMLILLAVMILYFLTIGEKIKEKTFDFSDTEGKQLLPMEKKEYSVRKMAMSGIVTVTAIVLIITKVVNNGVGAFLGASALIITGCVDIKTALQKVNWEVVVMAGSLLAFASGFNRSGASDLCVSMILRLFGDGTSFMAIYAAMLLLAIVLTNVIDNFATAALLAPIVISIALRFGVNATAALFGVLVACNVAYATPISCPCISMTISGGYRFKDYLRFGGLLSLIDYAVVLLVINFVYGL